MVNILDSEDGMCHRQHFHRLRFNVLDPSKNAVEVKQMNDAEQYAQNENYATEHTAVQRLHTEWQNVDTTIKEEAWRIVLKGCEICVRHLATVLETNEAGRLTISNSEIGTHRNALKMHTYLLCQFVDMFENELNAHAKSTGTIKVGRAKGKSSRRGAQNTESGFSSGLNLSMDWIEECEKAVNVLDQLCRLRLDKLWDPPVAEEDFINLPANCCYKILEDRTVASCVNVRISVTRLLATLVRRYGHSIACSVKLAQLLQCFPHMVNCLLAIVRSFVDEENLTGVVRELLKEICSYSSSDLERDAQATQNFSGFLQDFAAAYPTLAQSILPILRPRLDEDPYQIRNCVLGVIGEVLPMFARRENLDPKERVQRDRLMDLLQEHIHDVNGYVRAKALQIWYNIVTTGGLPIRRQSQLASLLVGTMGAMMDMSSLARKYACKTLTAMVLQCPAAKLTPNELQQVLNKETKRLENLEELLAKVSTLDENGNNLTEVEANTTNENDSTKAEKRKKKLNSDDSDELSDTDEPIESQSQRRLRLSESGRESGIDDERTAVTIDCNKDVTLCGTAESDAAAALEAAIHSAAASVSICQVSGNNPVHPSPLRSTTVTHAALTADVARQKACVAYLYETSAFSTHIQTAIKDFQSMLSSKTLTDVTEAIEFFVIAKQAGVKGLDAGIRQLLIQVWSQDEPIRKAVVEACRKLYLQPDLDEPISHVDQLTNETADIVATNLSKFIRGSQMGDLVSLERIIQHLIASDQFDLKLEDHLWNRFIKSASKADKESIEDAKSMLLIIKMIVRPGAAEFNRHLDTLIRSGLESDHPIDLERVKFTCEVLQKMVPRLKHITSHVLLHHSDLLFHDLTIHVLCILSNFNRALNGKPKRHHFIHIFQSGKAAERTKSSQPFRLPTNHNLFNRLRSILLSTITQIDQTLWIPMMEQAVGTIYDLAESPDIIVTSLLRLITEKIVHLKSVPPLSQTVTEIVLDSQQQQPTSPSALNNKDEENQIQSSQVKSDPERMYTVNTPAFILARFIALIGHVTLKQLVYMESSVLIELKRRAAVREERNSKSKSKGRKIPRQSRISTASMMENSTVNSSSATGQQMAVDEESGLVGVAADDQEADFIRHICDHEILSSPDHILTPLLNFVTYVCSNPSKFPDESVQASASLALAKMMLVNAEVCEPRLQLLFTMAERSQSEIVRANLVVALGDLCRRFPNLIEPWTPNLYARLRDSSAKVRTNALTTLSHLILNDMVKVKGQISEMTVCLVDEIERLNVLARRFFRELAQKGNALYNVVPDIISRLSDPSIGVSEESFHSIVEFLFPLIVKERLCETLVEKICARFRTTSLERQWRDLAHCLNVMPFNDRMMRVLYENLPAFADKLCITEVYSAFDCIITNMKKSTKADGMARLEEFEAKVNEFHEKGVADEAAVRRAELAAKALKQRPRHNKPSTSNTTAPIEPIRRNLRRTTRSRIVFSESEEEDEE